MHTLTAKLTFHIHHADSLKDKRQISRSLITKTRQKFNISIAEVDTQDIHRILTIGIAVVSGEYGKRLACETLHSNSLDEIVRFMECNEDAELTGVEYD